MDKGSWCGGLGKPKFHTILEAKEGKLVSQYCTIDDGAVIYELDRNRTEKLVAIRMSKQ